MTHILAKLSFRKKKSEKLLWILGITETIQTMLTQEEFWDFEKQSLKWNEHSVAWNGEGWFPGRINIKEFLSNSGRSSICAPEGFNSSRKKKTHTLFNYERGLIGIILRKRNKHHLEVQEGTKRYMPLLIFMGLPSLWVWQIRWKEV